MIIYRHIEINTQEQNIMHGGKVGTLKVDYVLGKISQRKWLDLFETQNY